MADFLNDLINVFEDVDDVTEDQSLQDRQDAVQFKVKTEDMFSKVTTAIKSLDAGAGKVEQVWRDSRLVRASGTSVSIAGGLITIAGGFAILMSAGIASPLLLTGLAVGLAGAGTNVAGSIMEAVINSTEVKRAERDLKGAKESIEDLKEIIEDWLKKKELSSLLRIQKLAAARKWSNPVLKVIGGVILAAKVASKGGRACAGAAVKALGEEAGKVGASAAGMAAAGSAGTAGAEAAGKAGAGTADDFLNVGMKTGSKFAGKVIIGVSAVFLLWDAVNLGLTINELVQNKGSDAAKDLIKKAKKLKNILNELEHGEMV